MRVAHHMQKWCIYRLFEIRLKEIVKRNVNIYTYHLFDIAKRGYFFLLTWVNNN